MPLSSCVLQAGLLVLILVSSSRAWGDRAPRLVLSSPKTPVAATVTAKLSVPVSAGAGVDLLSGEKVELRPEIAFGKLSFSFEPAIKARKVALESCASDFKDGLEFYAHPGARRVFVEGGVRTVTADFGSRLTEISTLTVNLRENSGQCLKSLRFINEAGHVFHVIASMNEVLDSGAVKSFEERYKRFASADLQAVLDRELIPDSSNDERWVFRLRGDGTFFVFGRSDDMRTSTRFSAIGDYDVKEVGKNRLKLLLNGYRITTPEPWDGEWRCRTSECREREIPALAIKVEDLIEIERSRGGGYMLRNRTHQKHRTLHFSDIRVTTSAP